MCIESECSVAFLSWLYTLKARPHCKSPGRIGEATWPSGLVEQLKSSGVNDKPSSFIASNEADRLHHPVRLNGGKHQRIADWLCSLWFFLDTIFVIHTPLPFHHHNRRSLEFAILRLRQTFLKMLNSQKCWTNTQYREFEGPAIVMRENWMMKIAAKKIENVDSIFSVTILVTQQPSHSPASSQSSLDPQWLMKIAPKKKPKCKFDFFSRDFRPPLHRNHRRILEFAILNLQTFLGIYSWEYRIRESCDYDGRGQNHSQKIGNISRPLKKHLKCGRDKSPGQVDRHQASRPSHSTNLTRQLAVWTHLKKFWVYPMSLRRSSEESIHSPHLGAVIWWHSTL